MINNNNISSSITIISSIVSIIINIIRINIPRILPLILFNVTQYAQKSRKK